MASSVKTFQELSSRFSLIPLKGKIPVERDWTRYCSTKREFKKRCFKGRNAGVACGPASGVIVLDVDDQKTFAVVRQKRGWELPETYTVTTGSDKPHYYYAYP